MCSPSVNFCEAAFILSFFRNGIKIFNNKVSVVIFSKIVVFGFEYLDLDLGDTIHSVLC